MAYDSSSARRQDDHATGPIGHQGFSGEPGFRDEPDFAGRTAFQPATFTPADGGAQVPPAVLDDVFDDPAEGQPGQDRLTVHWFWELALLLGVATLGVLLWQTNAEAMRGENLSGLLVTATGFLLLGMAAGLSLRVGAANLAIGPMAAAAAVYFAQRGHEGVAAPTTMMLVIALGLGVAVAVLVVGLHVPGWAASLGAAAAVVVWLYQQPAEVPLTGEFDPTGRAALLFLLVAVVAVMGGLIGTLKPVRRAVGRFRPVADPAARRGVLAALLAGLGIVVSMVLAVFAGVVIAAGAAEPVPAGTGSYWFELTMLGFAVALAGGTSAFGRRGGVFGTTLAALALVLFDRYQQLSGWGIALLATATGALVAGLALTRLVEWLGRPRSADEDDQEWSAAPATPLPSERNSPGSTWGSGADSWASSLPAQPAPEQRTGWDERWSQ